MHRTWLLVLGLATGLSAWAQNAATPRDIVQQRTPDGRVVFSDRPQPGAIVERTWRFAPEDRAAAEARRAAALREVQAIDERIARRLELQAERDKEIEIARLRLAAAQAAGDAERARAEAAAPRVVVAQPWWRPFPAGLQALPPRPSPRGPRPGSPNRPDRGERFDDRRR